MRSDIPEEEPAEGSEGNPERPRSSRATEEESGFLRRGEGGWGLLSEARMIQTESCWHWACFQKA